MLHLILEKKNNVQNGVINNEASHLTCGKFI